MRLWACRARNTLWLQWYVSSLVEKKEYVSDRPEYKYLWALWTIFSFLANKCDKIGERVMTIHVIWIFCLDVTGLGCSCAMMTRCMAWMLMVLWLPMNEMNSFRARTATALNHTNLPQLYWFGWDLRSLLLDLWFIIILWTMVFGCFRRAVLI